MRQLKPLPPVGRALPWALLLPLLLLAAPQAVHAQQLDPSTGELVYGARRKLPTFSLQNPHGYVDLTGRYSLDSTEPRTGEKIESSELLLEESLTLSTNGYIVHPNLVDLHLAGTFGLAQEWFDSNDADSSESYSTLYGWDVSATILRQQQAPLTLYTSRTQSFVDRSFGPTVEDTLTTYGADLNIRHKDVPTQLRAYRTEETQSGFNELADEFTLSQNVFEWHSEARPTPNQALTWNYAYSQMDQSGSGISESSDSQIASLGHSVSFGSRKQSSLSSSVKYSNTTGLLGSERFDWNELLRLRHTKDFETHYDYKFQQQNTGDVEQTLQRATAGFRHQLYKSLITTGQAGWQDVQLNDDSETQDWFASLGTSYRKKVPYGTFIANTGVNIDWQTNSARDTPVPVLDQPFSFVDFQPFDVNQQTIVPTSVVIQDATTGRIFAPGLDYTIAPIPGGVQLDRVIGGAISDGEPLLLSYDLGPTPASEITTTGFSAGLRYAIEKGFLRGLSPYARYAQVNQDISGGAGTLVPASSTDYVLGTEYERGEFQFKAEHESFDSRLYPFDANRFEARWDHAFSMDTTVTLDGRYTMTSYPVQESDVNTALLTGAFTRRLSRNLSLTAGASYVNVQASSGGETQGLEERLELRWHHRQMEVFMRLRNATLDTDTQDSSFQFFQVGLRREF